MITYEEAKRVFRYDEETGKLYWKIGGKCRKIGKESGYYTNGYRQVCFQEKAYQTHRVIWLMVYGEFPSGEKRFIDHLDGDGSNNRLNNLRTVSHAENCRNKKMYLCNKTGENGISFDKRSRKWKIGVYINGERKHIGYFATLEDAITARDNAIQEYCPNVYSERHGK
jgi:hypothetical protein